MLCLIKDPQDDLLRYLIEDPVRPHIPRELRIGSNRDIFMDIEDGQVRAITCVSYNDHVPHDEDDLFCLAQSSVAVFYTIWSYASGAGRDLLVKSVKHIQEYHQNIQRFVTLSPKTDMAKRFHLGNGAVILSDNPTSVNYEYINL